MSCIITLISPPPLRKNDLETVSASPLGCWAPPSGFCEMLVIFRGARAASLGTPSSLSPYSAPLAPSITGPSDAERSTVRRWGPSAADAEPAAGRVPDIAVTPSTAVTKVVLIRLLVRARVRVGAITLLDLRSFDGSTGDSGHDLSLADEDNGDHGQAHQHDVREDGVPVVEVELGAGDLVEVQREGGPLAAAEDEEGVEDVAPGVEHHHDRGGGDDRPEQRQDDPQEDP